VTVAFGDDRHEELSRFDRPGIEGSTVDLDVGAVEVATGRLGHLG